jgi:antitoxin (DNA-binding transcriptional repressor) of toxin-antitoxin stability system
LKADFSRILERVQAGEEVDVLYGKSRAPVARIVPIKTAAKARKPGALAGKARFEFSGEWGMTAEELVGR